MRVQARGERPGIASLVTLPGLFFACSDGPTIEAWERHIEDIAYPGHYYPALGNDEPSIQSQDYAQQPEYQRNVRYSAFIHNHSFGAKLDPPNTHRR